jgi:6-phosphofructokinase 2
MARSHGSKLILDTQGDALRATLPYHPQMVRLADYEARELAGAGESKTPGDLAEELMRMSAADLIVITLGARGAVARTADRTFEIRPPVVEVHSAVGAGDSFVAALTLGLARGWSADDAVRYGVAAAASAVTTSFNQLCERRTVNRYFEELGGRRNRAA